MKPISTCLFGACVVLAAAAACKPPEAPPAPPARSDSPPDSRAAMGGKPAPAPAAPAPGTAFEKAIRVDLKWDPHNSRVLAGVHLEPGFHAYGPGESTGKPLAWEFADPAWDVVEVVLPPGKEKDLGELGKSFVVTGDVEASARVKARGDAKPTEVQGRFHYQVCSETSCDRPRSVAFKLPTT